VTTRERRFKGALIAQANVVPGHRVLDLASGTGTLTIGLRQHQSLAEVIGVDGDPGILAIARRKARRAGVAVQFEQGLSDDLPYPTAHFDRVVTSLFLHHLEWPAKERTVREVWRVLALGGELHVADWGHPANALMRALFYSIQFLDGFANTQDHVAGRLPELFTAAGFEGVTETRSFATVYGTLALYRARKPG
jgi:ubiquinone/menaquinone biosynthesis C-methylase UbiE